MVPAKAGRFVGLANCCAVIALADNATFLMAVNRSVAFCIQATPASMAQPEEHLPHNLEVVGQSPT